MTRFAYALDAPLAETARSPKTSNICAVETQLLGAKAAGLREMTRLGLPVPPGFTLTGEAGVLVRSTTPWPSDLTAQIDEEVAKLSNKTGLRFDDSAKPLLVSVRSGSAVSMPGMLDTLLNIGLTETTFGGLATSGGTRFALDSFRRLIQMFGVIAREIPASVFRTAVRDAKTTLGDVRMRDADMTETALEMLLQDHLTLYESHTGSRFPDTASEQLRDAVVAVFGSWNNRRAKRYRAMQGISEHGHTACTVQAMVFGNLGPESGSGVAFTRNPSTGEPTIYGEFLANAQGEDVVSGIRTPGSLTATASARGKEAQSLEQMVPGAFARLNTVCTKLETHFGDIQDIEFTVQSGELFVLQTRQAKRSAPAAVRVAVDMVSEGQLTQDAALLQVDANCLEHLVQTRLPTEQVLAEHGIVPLATGLPAAPGATTGRIVFDAAEAVRRAEQGEDIILVRGETSSEDVHGMRAAQGVLTAAGGMTSHAAVVARGLGKTCVAGCAAVSLEQEAQIRITVPGKPDRVFKRGAMLTLDGTTGRVYEGALDVVAAPTIEQFNVLIGWADERRRLCVLAEADTPRAARAALSYGADGVGLCRTERMFFASERLHAVRCALLADTLEDRKPWLAELENAQREDFAEIFSAMQGRPVQIRLLDRPLHAFMPTTPEDHVRIAESLDTDSYEIHRLVRRHAEANPLLGHRGIRSGLTVEGLYEMQLRAMLSAAHGCALAGTHVALDIVVPMVGFTEEVIAVRQMLDGVRESLEPTEQHRATDHAVATRLGVMMEVPRSCLIADEIARHADFLSFGGNDITRMTLGMSKQDTGPFLAKYLSAEGPLTTDPFRSLDARGVGAMIGLAVERARRTNPDIEMGLCGDHGGDPASIHLAHQMGLASVSSPLRRLPVARLAAAQANIRV